MHACDECGFEYDLALAPAAGPAIRRASTELAAALADAADPSARRSPDVWSPLEYVCHVRDVLLVQRERVLLARRKDEPSLEPMGRDVRVEHDGYAHQDPEDVARELDVAASLLAGTLSRLGPADWERTVVYNWPSEQVRSLRWVAVHTVHEAQHHLMDLRRQVTG